MDKYNVLTRLEEFADRAIALTRGKQPEGRHFAFGLPALEKMVDEARKTLLVAYAEGMNDRTCATLIAQDLLDCYNSLHEASQQQEIAGSDTPKLIEQIVSNVILIEFYEQIVSYMSPDPLGPAILFPMKIDQLTVIGLLQHIKSTNKTYLNGHLAAAVMATEGRRSPGYSDQATFKLFAKIIGYKLGEHANYSDAIKGRKLQKVSDLCREYLDFINRFGTNPQ